MRRLLLILAACGGASSPPHAASSSMGHDHEHHHPDPLGHRFEHADQWTAQFDDPKRDEWQKPDAVVAALALAPGMSVADIGAGTGYFEARLAKAVGDTGKVIALDVEADMVRYLRERAARDKTPNVEARQAASDDPSLAAASVDRILIVDTWHHIPEREAYAKKLAAALKPGGAVFVVDFTQETEKGPPREHRVPIDQVKRELEAGGLSATVVEVGLPDQFLVKGAASAR